MATYVLCPLSTFMSVFNNSGLALTNGLIWTYAAGTSNPTNTWTDSTGSVLNSNPIQLTVGGTLNNVNIYQLAGSKIKVQFSTNAGTVGSPVFGVQIGPTFDNVVGVGDTTTVQNTYYGGTDTGSANAYVLTFSALFTSYVNGTIIYFIPSNTNTGASTLNVNGLGALNITYASGIALGANQLLANQIAVVAVSGGAFVYLGSNPTTAAGVATLSGTGFSAATNFTATYSILGKAVTLFIAQNSGTSNSTSFGMTLGGNTGLAPNTTQFVNIAAAQDNGSALYAQTATIQATGLGHLSMTFYKNGSSTGWTNSGTKGVGDGIAGAAVAISYLTT